MSYSIRINAQNYFDPIRADSQNSKGLYRKNKEQHACPK